MCVCVCVYIYIYIYIYIMVLMNLENKPMGMGGREEREGEMYGESNMETYITMCKIDSQYGNLLYA